MLVDIESLSILTGTERNRITKARRVRPTTFSFVDALAAGKGRCVPVEEVPLTHDAVGERKWTGSSLANCRRDVVKWIIRQLVQQQQQQQQQRQPSRKIIGKLSEQFRLKPVDGVESVNRFSFNCINRPALAPHESVCNQLCVCVGYEERCIIFGC